MMTPPIPFNEDERLKALKDYSILDTMPEKEYDDITFLASQICQTPISLVSLIDDKRQWFKSHHGTTATQTPREIAFCAHAINEQNSFFVVPDSRKDDRFKDNPLVTGYPNVVFYAGIPLVTPNGFALGTLCIIDQKPKELTELQITSLKALANQLLKLFELRKSTIALHQLNDKLNIQNKKLNEFVRMAAHDIKSPLNTIGMMAELVINQYARSLEPTATDLLKQINGSAVVLSQLVDGILRNSKDADKVIEEIHLKPTIEAIIRLLGKPETVTFNVNVNPTLKIANNKTVIQQILANTISNSIKYNDKPQPTITVEVQEKDEWVEFHIIDNGPGIKSDELDGIFELFGTTSNTDKNGFHGTGIGLATVKSLVENLGGEVKLFSEPTKGLHVFITIKK